MFWILLYFYLWFFFFFFLVYLIKQWKIIQFLKFDNFLSIIHFSCGGTASKLWGKDFFGGEWKMRTKQINIFAIFRLKS